MIDDVALWYMRYHKPDYDLFGNEADAAQHAVWMAVSELEEPGTPLGVQFSDGRTIPLDEWQAFADWRRQHLEAQAAKAAEPKPPPPPMRKARDPFTGRPVEIEVSEPSWLGKPEGSRP